MTFDEAELKGGDIVVVVSDTRGGGRWPEGMEIKLRDTKRGIRAPDMTNGSGFVWKLKE